MCETPARVALILALLPWCCTPAFGGEYGTEIVVSPASPVCFAGLSCTFSVEFVNMNPSPAEVREIVLILPWGTESLPLNPPNRADPGETIRINVTVLIPLNESQGFYPVRAQASYLLASRTFSVNSPKEIFLVRVPEVKLSLDLDPPDVVEPGAVIPLTVSYSVDSPQTPDLPLIKIYVNDSMVNNATLPNETGRYTFNLEAPSGNQFVLTVELVLGEHFQRKSFGVKLGGGFDLARISSLISAAESLLKQASSLYAGAEERGVPLPAGVVTRLTVASVRLEEAKRAFSDRNSSAADLSIRSMNASTDVISSVLSALERDIVGSASEVNETLNKAIRLGASSSDVQDIRAFLSSALGLADEVGEDPNKALQRYDSAKKLVNSARTAADRLIKELEETSVISASIVWLGVVVALFLVPYWGIRIYRRVSVRWAGDVRDNRGHPGRG